jgi:hypothetical protein
LAKIIKLEENINKSNNIYIYSSPDKSEKSFLYEGISLLDCGIWCIDNGFSTSTKASTLKSHISKSCLEHKSYLQLFFSYDIPDFIKTPKNSNLLILQLLDYENNVLIDNTFGLNKFSEITKINKHNLINNMKGITKSVIYNGIKCHVVWKLNNQHCRLYKELYGLSVDKIEENPLG